MKLKVVERSHFTASKEAVNRIPENIWRQIPQNLSLSIFDDVNLAGIVKMGNTSTFNGSQIVTTGIAVGHSQWEMN